MFFFFDENENKVGVPGFEETIQPILIALHERGGKASIAELNETTIRIMNLSEEVTQIMHKDSSRQSEIEYRMAWGRTYLKKYGLITNSSRGIWEFTEKFDGDIENIDVEELVRKVRTGSVGTGDGERKVVLTGFESARAFENMVVALLRELAHKEGKRANYTYSDFSDLENDMVLPDGLEGITDEIKCIIEYVNASGGNLSDFYHKVLQKVNAFLETDRVLVITNVIVRQEDRNRFGQNVMIWDRKDLLERIEPDSPYAQYLINPRQALIGDEVIADVSHEQKSLERRRYLKQTKDAFRKQDLVLFLGAGVSIDGGIPLWETLIKTLHVHMLNQLTRDKGLSFKEKEMIKELASDNEIESPLMQMRYIKGAFSDEKYYELVHTALYAKKVNLNTKLLNAIAKISKPQRTYCGIKSIITYNFDDLLERKFEQEEIQYNIISEEEGRQLVEKLNVYHVHGYLPSNFSKNSGEPNLIFSEEDYHKVYRDAYSWSNLTQLSALRESTGLFIGCSLTDPNLRRLLDVAARSGESPRHYAFLKKKQIGEINSDKPVNKKIREVYQKMDDNIQTAYYRNLGLNIIWIDDYEEIPALLNGLLA